MAMQKWLLAAAVVLFFAGNAQAREYFSSDLYYTGYAGTPNYPDNFSDTPPIFDGLADIDFWDFTLIERYPTNIVETSTIGGEFFYKGRKVGEVQNVEASPFPNILFTEAKFFISDPGTVEYSYPECPWETCGIVTAYADTYVHLDSVTFTYWDHTVNPVPEPQTYAMMLAGLGLLGMARQRKHKT
jgi:uncharacterized protein (DUF1330 family)